MLFPLVFLLAALLNAVNGIFELKTRGRDKKKVRCQHPAAGLGGRSYGPWHRKRHQYLGIEERHMKTEICGCSKAPKITCPDSSCAGCWEFPALLSGRL